MASPPCRAQPHGRAGGPDHHRQKYPAGNRGDHPLDQVIDDALVELRRVEVHEAVGAAEDDDEDSREKKEPGQGHDEGRDPEPGGQRPLEGAEHAAADERGEYGCPPRPARPGLHQLEGDHSADKRDRADREVDLRDEQDHCLSYRQHHVHGAQPEDIHEVARPQEGVLGGDDLEDDGDHHHGQDHGQDTAVAAADPEPPGPEVLAQRLGEELGRDVGRGLSGGGEVGRRPGVRRPGRGLAGVRGHGGFPIRGHGLSPRHWRIRQARTAARWSHLSSCTPPRSAGRSPRPALRPPSAPGTAPRSGPRPRRCRSGCGRSP